MIKAYSDYALCLIQKHKGIDEKLKNCKKNKDIDKVFDEYGIKNLHYRKEMINVTMDCTTVTTGTPSVEYWTVEQEYEMAKEMFLTGTWKLKEKYKLLEAIKDKEKNRAGSRGKCKKSLRPY